MTGKRSLIGPKTITSRNTTTQLKTAQKHDQKILPLPIRVCTMLIRVWHANSPQNTRQCASKPAIQPTHTRMAPLIRVWYAYPHSPYAYHQRRFYVQNSFFFPHTRMAPSHTRTTQLPAYRKVYGAYQRLSLPPPGHLIRVWPSVIRVWPDTKIAGLLWDFSATRFSSIPTFHSPISTEFHSHLKQKILPIQSYNS